jgi:hypothetical protein
MFTFIVDRSQSGPVRVLTPFHFLDGETCQCVILDAKSDSQIR